MRVRSAAAISLLVLVAGACTAVKQDDVGTAVSDLLPSTTLAPGVTAVPPPPTTTVPPIDLAAVNIRLEEVARLEEPTALAARFGDPAVFITERTGRVRRIEITTRSNGAQTFAVDRTPALDLSDDVATGGLEQGLLGIAFSTDGNRMYVGYTDLDENQRLVEYRMNGERADASSRRELLLIADPDDIHNAGAVAFGPDGFLYWAMGDGGPGGDPQGTGQDPTDLLGNLLRIDPDVAPEAEEAGQAYAIPDGNPFRDGTDGAPEVWAYGLRNPWRFSFDSATGDLWIADVGQETVEEIDYLAAADGGTGAGRAANLGWSDVEGDRIREGSSAPDDAVEPVLTYDHASGGCAITGGYVYRGARVPALVGAYVWGDHCLGELQALVVTNGLPSSARALGVTVPQLTSFGQDSEGELWALSLQGPVYRVLPA
ncbi:MAG: PQQ-dependent sugar dehydrogenase [Actinomycetota bacterium]|nr:PQQ-dependent sugar dehydrogenase [Acidimicrobiia bacterium]MDQ3293302.1 PQQ-dependent sugar dehydrogenase [Actinomycetota bacterium]